MKQVLIYDKENRVRHGGILLDNGDVVCACCGGLIPQDEIENICNREETETLSKLGIIYDCDCEAATHQLLKVFPDWINLVALERRDIK